MERERYTDVLAVVVAQLTAKVASIPENPASIPVISYFYVLNNYLLLTVCIKDQIKKKRPLVDH